jgi:hypothetical protein
MGTPTGRWEPFQPEAGDEELPASQTPPEQRAYASPGLTEAAGQTPLQRRAYAAPYQSLTFSLVTRARRELTVTLATQPVFDLTLSAPVSRRIRRTIRHQGGERALMGLGRRTLEPVDLRRIDLQTLRHGLEMLRLGAGDSGVMPAFWRTVASSGGRFALLCAEMQHAPAPGSLFVEVMGGLEQAPPDAIAEAVSHFETASQGVILHIAPDIASARRMIGTGVRCLSIDFAGVAHETIRDWQIAAELIHVARLAAPHVLLLNLRPDHGLAAQAAGATHAVFANMEAVTI